MYKKNNKYDWYDDFLNYFEAKKYVDMNVNVCENQDLLQDLLNEFQFLEP